MKINLKTKNKRLLTWLSGASLLSAGFITQSFGSLYEDIKRQANYELQYGSNYQDIYGNQDNYRIIEGISKIISWAKRSERNQILSYLSHLSKKSNYPQELKDLLRMVELRYYINEFFLKLRYSKDDPSEYFRRGRCWFFLVNANLPIVQGQMLWLMRRISNSGNDLISRICILEAYIRYISRENMLHATYKIQENDIFAKGYPMLQVPEESSIEKFIELWKSVDPNNSRYKIWSYSNGNRLVKAIKKGRYADIVAHVIGYVLLLDGQSVDGLKKTYQQKEWFWNRKKIQKNKSDMGHSINQYYKLNQLSQNEKRNKGIGDNINDSMFQNQLEDTQANGETVEISTNDENSENTEISTDIL